MCSILFIAYRRKEFKLMKLFDWLFGTVTLDVRHYQMLINQIASDARQAESLKATIADHAVEIERIQSQLKNAESLSAELLDKLSVAVAAKQRELSGLTSEAVARRIGVPERLVGMIDFDRLSIQGPDDFQRKR